MPKLRFSINQNSYKMYYGNNGNFYSLSLSLNHLLIFNSFHFSNVAYIAFALPRDKSPILSASVQMKKIFTILSRDENAFKAKIRKLRRSWLKLLDHVKNSLFLLRKIVPTLLFTVLLLCIDNPFSSLSNTITLAYAYILRSI